jgi:hypothetical protein
MNGRRSARAVVLAAGLWACGPARTSSDAGVPDAGLPDDGPPPVALASRLPNPFAITVDSTNVYWTDLGTSSGNGAILQTPIAGGEIITLAFGQAQPIAIAVDEAQVFWIASDDVLAVPIGGGQLTTIATDPLHPAALVDDGTNLYWLDSGNGADGALIGWSPASGTATTLAAALSKSQALTFDTDTLYWATFASDGAIESLPKAGGAMAATLASGLGGILALAVDATSVYSTNHFDGTITRTPKTGGLPITLASGFTGLSGLAVDATDLYWTDTGTGYVDRLPLAGGQAPATAAHDQATPTFVVTGGGYLFWTNAGMTGYQAGIGAAIGPDGSIMRLTK